VIILNKNDLRYIKTEDNLKQALLTLMKDITIKMICEVARCSRNTFYLHYEVKEDLYNTLVSNVLSSIEGAFTNRVDHIDQINDAQIDEYSDNIMAGVSAHEDTLRVLILKDNGLFLNQFTKTIQDTVLKSSSQMSNNAYTVKGPLYSAYLAGAISGFIFNWFKNPVCDLQTATKDLKAIHHETIKVSLKQLKNQD